jgi:hypothetical protein
LDEEIECFVVQIGINMFIRLYINGKIIPFNPLSGQQLAVYYFVKSNWEFKGQIRHWYIGKSLTKHATLL